MTTDNSETMDSELIIGLVGAVGARLKSVIELLKEQLHLAGYETRVIKVSEDVIKSLVDVPRKARRLTSTMMLSVCVGKTPPGGNRPCFLSLSWADIEQEVLNEDRLPAARRACNEAMGGIRLLGAQVEHVAVRLTNADNERLIRTFGARVQTAVSPHVDKASAQQPPE